MPFSLSVSPPKSEIILKEGQVASKAFNLENTSPNPVTLRIESQQWIGSDFEGGVKFIDDPGPISFTINNSDLRGQGKFTIPPNSKQQIVLGISQNPNTKIGDYYYTVFFSQLENLENNPNASQTTGKIGSHFLLHIGTPEEKNTAKIESFTTSPFFADNLTSNILITGLVKNTGSKFFNLKGFIDIKKNNQTVKQLVLAGDTVLSGHGRTIRCIDNPFSKEPQTIPCVLTSPNQPGLYTITLNLTQDIQATGVNTITKLLFPSLILFIFFTLISAVFVLKKSRLLTRFP